MTESFELAGTTAQSPVVRFSNAGRDLSCEATSLRDKQYLQDQLDVFNILRGHASLMDDLDVRSPSRDEPEVNWSMKKMAKMYNVGTSFWHLCLTDIPWQLGEGTRTSLLDVDLGINPASTTVQDQFLSRHPSYESAVLRSRQTNKFQRNDSVNLVREYLSCIDEVSQLLSISQRKIDFLNKLKKDYQDGLKNHGANESVSEDDDDGNPLFQLRTIEQNELAIIAESNNKAILVFTVVTIIFLPLSFFTSYFGMNVQNTEAVLKGQGFFWGVCGSITLVLVVSTLVYGFKERLYNWVWGDRHAQGRVEDYYRPTGA
ncbi:MAG: hypothetical protein Q9169_005198 [Polycauliona sp. 2 TL-2023]